LERRGAATQLIVDGKPVLMLAGELGNNAATTVEAARPIWPNLVAMHLLWFGSWKNTWSSYAPDWVKA
jgi:hypothetical protein